MVRLSERIPDHCGTLPVARSVTMPPPQPPRHSSPASPHPASDRTPAVASPHDFRHSSNFQLAFRHHASRVQPAPFSVSFRTLVIDISPVSVAQSDIRHPMLTSAPELPVDQKIHNNLRLGHSKYNFSAPAPQRSSAPCYACYALFYALSLIGVLFLRLPKPPSPWRARRCPCTASGSE